MTGDPYWDNVVFLSGFEGGAAVDESPLAQTVTVSGGPTLSSVQAKFGTQSLLRGATGRCSVPDHASFPLGTTPFTAECFIYMTEYPSTYDMMPLMGQIDWVNTTGPWLVTYDHNWYGAGDGAFVFWADSDGYVSGADNVCDAQFTPDLNTWYHVAFDFDGSNYYVHVDGIDLTNSYGTGPISLNNETNPLTIGATDNDGGDGFIGYIDEARLTVGVSRYGAGNFTPPAEAFPRGPEDDLDTELVEGIGLFGGCGLGDVFSETLSQGIGAHLTARITRYDSISSTFSATYLIDAIRAQPALVEDEIGVAAALYDIRGVLLLQRMALSLAQVPNSKSHLVVDDAAGIAAELRTAVPGLLEDEIGIALTQQAVLALQIIDELELEDVVAPLFKYSRSVAETIGIAAALARFFGADIDEGIGLSSTLVGNTALSGLIAEGVGLAATLTPSLLIKVTVADGVELDDVDVLQMIYSPEVVDSVSITGAYLSPGGGITTWAMNTRTAAVTEYSNYEFNSFARLGDKYIGASANGLYELVGDDDDGEAIIARIKSGFFQWAGSRFTLFKAAYLGIRGGGDFVLRLTTGDGKTYDYAVAARDMRSTKVKIGKGIRTRYFCFELISAGDDFDLESVEFVPLVAERRV